MGKIKIENLIFFISLFIAFIPYTSIASHVSQYINIIFFIFIFTSIFFHFKGFLIPVWIINIISVVLIFQTLITISAEDILTPSVEALALILSIRFIGKKTSREYFQIYLLSLLLLGASSLFNISWIFILRVLIFLFTVIFSILLLTYVKDTQQRILNVQVFLNLLKIALFISIFSVPLSIFFFIILPRAPTPIFDIGFAKAKTGFTSNVSLGSVASIEEDRSVVMRVKMSQIPDKNLYWRVITFDSFDGKNWIRTVKEGKTKISGQKITYTVFLESLTEKYLPTLDYPLHIYHSNLIYEYPGIFKTNFVETGMKYNATSFGGSYLEEERVSEEYLKLPTNLSKRIIDITDEITKTATSHMEIIERIMKFLGNYQYSLKNLPIGDNPIEEFLFTTKSGNCEYFATATALMLRIKGIPSRVVGGFRGGSYNQFGGYYLVRASDAHLWVEAWINGKWLRLDPSGRIPRKSESVIFNLIDYLWNSLVIDYNLKTQIKLAKSLKIPKVDFQKNFFIYIVGLGLILFIVVKIYKILVLRRKPLYRFLNLMSKHGFNRERNQGLEEFLEKIENSELKEKALLFITAYQELYFKDRIFKKDEIRKLNKIIEYINESFKNRRGKN